MRILDVRKKRRNDPELLPSEQPIITSIKVLTEGHELYLYGDQMTDYITLYLSDKDIFEELLGEYSKDSAFFDYLERHLFRELDGIELEEELELLSRALNQCEGNEIATLIRFLVFISNTEHLEYSLYKNKELSEISFRF